MSEVNTVQSIQGLLKNVYAKPKFAKLKCKLLGSKCPCGCNKSK